MAEMPGTVTLLFADIEGSTRLVQRLGEDGYGAALSEFRRLIRGVVAEHGGEEVDCRADELFAVFARAEQGVSAAVAGQRALASQSWPEGAALRVRMGLNSGQPFVLDGVYVGVDVNRAARICSAGHGGQVLCSQTVYDAVSDGCDFKDLGRYVLAGLPAAERVFQLVMPDARLDFPVLRVAPAKTGARRELRSWRRKQTPSLEDAAWQIRALLPRVSGEVRGSLGELGGSLFTAQRAVERSDGFLSRIDHARLAKRLADQREMTGFLERADHEAAALQAQITAVERAAGQQQALTEIAPRVLALLGDHQAVTVADLDPLRERIAACTTRLDAAVTTAAAIVDPLSFKLKRTRHRGVYRSGGRYIVPFVDSLGRDRIRDFEALSQAHDFRLAIRIADKAQSDYHGPSFKGHEGGGGGSG